MPGGAFVIDTPGMREFQLSLSDVDGAAGIDSVFADIEELAAQCRFADCSHESEPGCAVREQIDADRLASYHKLLREIVRDDPDVARERRRQGKIGAKAYRRMKR